MGGDFGMDATIPACCKFLEEYPNVKLVLVGDRSQILHKFGPQLDRYNSLELIHAPECVDMQDEPRSALRKKKQSSMRVAIDILAQHKVNAVISSGNTGALMLTAYHLLGTIEGVERAAIAKILPSMSGEGVCMLDLGANLEATPNQLFQFGIMGAQLMRCVYNVDSIIGLLNIGSESIKGHEYIKNAAELFKQYPNCNFYGNVEGNDINTGIVNVVVCDGFTGNVTLKTMEGIAHMINKIVTSEFKRNLLSKAIGILAYPVINCIKRRLDARQYNGAMFLGLNNVVVKSHGSTDYIGFYHAMEVAYKEARHDVITSIKEKLSAKKNI
jgi:glycerol-3-phosphate acyltransferase PlsX